MLLLNNNIDVTILEQTTKSNGTLQSFTTYVISDNNSITITTRKGVVKSYTKYHGKVESRILIISKHQHKRPLRLFSEQFMSRKQLEN